MLDTSYIERALAVAGGAAIGAILVGILTQFLTKLVSGRKLPPWTIRGVRLLSGVTTGWLVTLLLFGPGGHGHGGAGLLPGGEGNGTAAQQATVPAATRDRAAATSGQAEEGGTLVFMVEEMATVKAELGQKGLDDARFFRLQGANELIGPDAVIDAIRQQHQQQGTGLKQIDFQLVGGDSPDRNSPLLIGLEYKIQELGDWANREKLKIRRIGSPVRPAR